MRRRPGHIQEASVISARVRRSTARFGLAGLLSLVMVAAISGGALARSAEPLGARPVGAHHVGQAKKVSGPTPVLDHAGLVLLHSRTVPIFWGPTADFAPGLQTAMTSLLAGMNGSAYLGVAQQYMRTATGISSTAGAALFDTSVPPKQALQPNGLAAEVAKLVPTPDPNTIYFVFTSNMPNINYCAYHSDATANGVVVEVAYVPVQPAGCYATTAVNLHANGYSDAVQAAADSTAHEFMEAVTDPHLDAWYDRNGAEVSDKCEYDYQGIVHLANRTSWQIQSTWSNAIMACDPGLGK
jgi:hypothetical protein